jgi:hypothetical protein
MVRMEKRDIPLVFMSGDAGIAESDVGVPLGPTLQKPVSIDELIRVLNAKFLAHA